MIYTELELYLPIPLTEEFEKVIDGTWLYFN